MRSHLHLDSLINGGVVDGREERRGINSYASDALGRNFLVNQILDDPPTPPITVILNLGR